MRPWSKAAAAALLLGLAAGPARARGRVYDPEVALLLLNVQQQSLDLIRDEMLRQAEWLNLGAMRAVLPEKMPEFERQVRAKLTVDSDVIEDYKLLIENMSPSNAPEAEALVAEIRRYHDLRPGPPLERIPIPPISGDGPSLLEENGPGADVAAALTGTPIMDEPIAYAERHFGTTGPFLRRRKWNLDFYLGSFNDLIPHYRALGYRRLYRLRAAYMSFGRSAYVLAPEPGLRPRMVYCAFYGQDLFLHTRAQWAELTKAAKGQGPEVRTLTCPDCRWVLPGVREMNSLLATVPYTADEVVIGYDELFAQAWKDSLLGIYENDYWRLAYYQNKAGVVVTVQARHTDFGEILAASMEPLIRRGAKEILFGGPAAIVDGKLDPSDLALPTDFVTFAGQTLALDNALIFARHPKPTVFAALPSPLLATKEWINDARGHGVAAFDGEMSRLVEDSSHWKRLDDGGPVRLGIGAVLGGISNLHPEEDRAVYTRESASRAGRESAKAQFVKEVQAALNAAARDRRR
ncbi:MAG: hypothetical protein KGJ84_05930 [Elusimicrobia bacterium]|nr:hypothetical protein [Elusimicrobiota bacterium]